MSMPKGRSLTLYEREKIETYLRMKKEKAWIAKKLKRDYSIIKREIKRNSGECLPYNAEMAERLANQRAKKTNIRKLDKPDNAKLKNFVEEKIIADFSPEQIAGILKEDPSENTLNEIKSKIVTDLD